MQSRHIPVVPVGLLLLTIACSKPALAQCDTDPCVDLRCYEEIQDLDCVVSVSDSIAIDKFGDWEIESSTVCDTCCSENEISVKESLKKTVGWKYCFTLGGSYTIKVPLVSEWSISASGEICHDRTRERTFEMTVHCKPHTRSRANLKHRTAKASISTTLTYVKRAVYIPKRYPPDGCFSDRSGDRETIATTCGTSVNEYTTDVVEYEVVVVDEICPDPLDCPK